MRKRDKGRWVVKRKITVTAIDKPIERKSHRLSRPVTKSPFHEQR